MPSPPGSERVSSSGNNPNRLQVGWSYQYHLVTSEDPAGTALLPPDACEKESTQPQPNQDAPLVASHQQKHHQHHNHQHHHHHHHHHHHQNHHQHHHHHCHSDSDDEITWRDTAIDLLQGNVCQCLMSSFIVGNAAVIGFETDLPDMRIWETLETIFLLLFTVELAIRIIVFRPSVFFDVHNHDFVWNTLDFIIVSVGIIDSGFVLLSVGSPTGGLSTLFRIVRLLRILRIVRLVRFMRQLYLLAFGFVEAAQAVMWVSILMLFVLYVCAVLLVKTVGRQADEENVDAMLQNFDGIPRTMLTLFEVMASPTIAPFEGVMYDYPLVAVFLVAFVIFGSFGMIALLTGVVSESMFQKNQVKQEEERREHGERRKILQQKSEELFSEVMDTDTGEASIEDVKELTLDIEEMFSSLGIEFEYADLDNFAGIIDTDGSGAISKQEFQHGIMSMAHGTQSMSTMELYYHLCILKAKLDKSEPLWQHASVSAQKMVASTDALSVSIDHVANSLQKIVDVQQDLSHQNAEMLQTKASIFRTLQQFNEKFSVMLEAQDRVEKQASKVETCVSATSELKETVAVFHQDFLTLHEDTAMFHAEMSDFLDQTGHKRCSMQGGNRDATAPSVMHSCSDAVTNSDDTRKVQDATFSCPPTHASSVQVHTCHDASMENAECNVTSGTTLSRATTQSSLGVSEKCQRPSRRLMSKADLSAASLCAEIKEYMQSEIQQLSEMWRTQTLPVASLPECQQTSDSTRIGSASCSATTLETQQLLRELLGSQQTTFKNMIALSTQVDSIVSGQRDIQSEVQHLCETLKDANCWARIAQMCQSSMPQCQQMPM